MFNSSMVYYGSIVQVLVPFVDERTCLATDARYIRRWIATSSAGGGVSARRCSPY